MHSKEEAYKLSSPESHRAYYDKWAESYDSDFVDAQNYKYPEKIYNIYTRLASVEHTPIADVGCGTGVLGEQFFGKGVLIDGFDISTGMLLEAKRKGIYRNLCESDITKTETLPSGGFGAVISCGTFTFGHLGPQYLNAIIQMLQKGGLGIIGINKAHFINSGFEDEINSLESSKKITKVEIFEELIYSSGSIKASNITDYDQIASVLTFKT